MSNPEPDPPAGEAQAPPLPPSVQQAPSPKTPPPLNFKSMARILDGRWGYGTRRKQQLEDAGYDYAEVTQAIADLRTELTE